MRLRALLFVLGAAVGIGVMGSKWLDRRLTELEGAWWV